MSYCVSRSAMICWLKPCIYCTMKDKKVIGIRYCGGCNPRYDRTAAVRSLQEQFPKLKFCLQTEDGYDGYLAICGCTAGCARVCLPKDARTFAVCGAADLTAAAQWLQTL